MRHRLRSTVMTFVVASFGCAPLQYDGVPVRELQRRDAATVAAVLSEVQGALATAQDSIRTLGISPTQYIKGVKLTLKAGDVVKNEGGIDFLIFSLGTEIEHEDETSMSFNLGPVCGRRGAGLDPEGMTRFFVDAILAGAAAAAAAPANARLPLSLKDVTAKIGFEVASSGSAGLEVEILPVTPKLSGTMESSASHQAEVTLSTTDPCQGQPRA